MTELYEEFFKMLRLAKNLYDYGLADRFRGSFDSYQLDGDNCWGLAYEATGWVFSDTRQYYNEEIEVETWLFCDPVIDRFCRLCQKYEDRRGISEGENPYRRDMERIMHDGFCFSGYSYGYGYSWRLSPKDRGRKCLLLFTDNNFCNSDEVPEGLLDIKDGFESMNAQLEKELSKETRMIPLALTETYKEAA